MQKIDHLLLVEDHFDVQKSYVHFLSTMGYRVEIATTLMEARRYVLQVSIDLVLLDLHLPDGGGIEFMQWNKRQKKPAKVLVISGRGSAKSALEAGRLGAVDYVEKPCDGQELMRVVCAALKLNSQTDFSRSEDAIAAYMRTHVECSKQDIANHFCVSEKTVLRHVYAATGLNFMEYLYECRLAEAERLLIGSELSIREIAAKVGFRSPQHFARLFRQRAACNPCQFRRRMRSL